MAEKLDIILFGATGFTGKHCIYEGVKLMKDFKWGIAGRSKDKLEAVLKEMGTKAGADLSKIPIIIADIKDEESLKKMAEQCKVVVNCTGPYRIFGEPVVKACVEAGSHHVDVSGEPFYQEGMQLKYNEKAKEKGVYIISACGFDSIPADLGTMFLEQNFDGEVNSVETYLTVRDVSNSKGAMLNYGTYESAVLEKAYESELHKIREELFPTELPKQTPVLKSRFGVHKRTDLGDNSWCVEFLGSDRGVQLRSQRTLYEIEKKRPVQIQTYMTLSSFLYVLMFAFYGGLFLILTRFKCGRNLLLKHPKFFSGGFVSREGPSEEKMINTKFSTVFSGLGWPKSEKKDEQTGQYSTPPTKKIVTKVTGTNPAYGATCVSLLFSAITILKESDKMPNGGGVLSPGAAFAKTGIISELCKNGFTFEVLEK